ncbi:MAG: glycosyltransferase family protein [Pseudomonadota bacterium]
MVLEKRNSSIVAIIQARLGSTRLPGKVLKQVNNRTLLSYMIERVRKSKMIDNVVVATTTSPSDDQIVQWCKKENVLFYRGSEEDVLSRYHEAAKEQGASVIVRLTSDCPLMDPKVVDLVVQNYLTRPEIDFVSNTVPLPCLYPDGMDVEVFSFDLLTRANQEAVLPSEREHVTFYMWKTGKFNIYRIDPEHDYSKYRFTVDYPQDFEVIKTVLNELYQRNPDFSMYDLISFMAEKPSLLELNQEIERNAGWQRAFEKDREVVQ